MYKDLLKRAEKPLDNPEALTAARYSITLIADDYPGRTPRLWNAVYRAFDLGIEAAMYVVEPQHLALALNAFRSDPRYIGGGIGVGLKDEAVGLLDQAETLAKAIGSVNVIGKVGSNQLMGWNTDGQGYLESLKPLLEKKGWVLPGLPTLLLGAGGTANAIGFALALAGAKLTILNRTVSKAEDLAKAINRQVGSDVCRAGGEDLLATESAGARLIINATTKGASGPLSDYAALAPAPLPATRETVAKNHELSNQILATISGETIISDVVLGSSLSPTLTLAFQQGLDMLDGLPMVKSQAVLAFWLVHESELVSKGITKTDIARVMDSVLE